MGFSITGGRTATTAFGAYHHGTQPFKTFHHETKTPASGPDWYGETMVNLMAMSVWSSRLEMGLRLSESETGMDLTCGSTAQGRGRSSNQTKRPYTLDAPGIASITHTEMIAISIIVICASLMSLSNVVGRFHKPLYKKGG